METVSFPRRGAAGVATLTALAVTVVLTACSAGTAGPATAPGASGGAESPGVVPSGTAGSALRWSACGSQLAGMECASLQVPLNYADPGGRKITIALSMVPATAPKSQQQGVMLVNPGGPGAPGRWLAGATATSLSPQVAADYDIVGFDPRGVGGSVPALSCDPGYFSGSQPDYIPANAAAEQVLINKAKTYASDCEQRFGWLLPYETSVNMARDMDLIRQAFGVQKITYYGFSWGTYLGQVYGTLFPSRVRRMVLDSTVDPTGVWYQDNIAQDYAFQARLDAFYAWIAKYDSVYNLGSTAAEVRSAFYRARNQLAANPVTGPGGQPIGPDEYDDTFLIGAYLNRDRLSEAQTTSIRYAASLAIYLSSTADILLIGVAQAPWLPLVLAALSLAGIFAGIALRVRGFFLLGLGFLGLSLLTIIWHAAVDLRQTWLWSASGIVAGFLIIGLFALFEKKRQDVLRVVDEFKQWNA